jgi:hypothetical protein
MVVYNFFVAILGTQTHALSEIITSNKVDLVFVKKKNKVDLV